jgi:tRNA(Ile)-lysidine synthase
MGRHLPTDACTMVTERLRIATSELRSVNPMPLPVPLPHCTLEKSLQMAWPSESWSRVTVLVAVSGGPDSTALLRALHRLRSPAAPGRLVVGHFNHRLRGDDSEADAAFVQSLAAELDLACETGIADSSSAATSEDAARTARYTFLLGAAQRIGARYVAVAHTADDQAETILFRLLRGTGLAGLTGMPGHRPLSEAITLIRPLLQVRRQEVQRYLHAIGQSARLDRSNADLRFSRNRLRHETLPQLEQTLGTDMVEHLVRLGCQAEELLAPIRAQAQQLLAQALHCSDDRVQLNLSRLNLDAGSSPNRPVLREMFVQLWRQHDWPRGEMHAARWDELVDLLTSPAPAARMYPGGLRAEKKGESLVVTRPGRGFG